MTRKRYGQDLLTKADLKDVHGYVDYRKVKGMIPIPEGCKVAYEVKPSWQKPNETYRYFDLDQAEDTFLSYINQGRGEARLQRIAVMQFPNGKWRRVSIIQAKFNDREEPQQENIDAGKT